MAPLTPMMRQYTEIKDNYKDHILFYRLGDFYEMFYDDAKLASEELDLVLTGRDCGQEERAPMCGIPYHSCEGYIARLVKKGYKIAMCEQVEDPKTAKGLVKREVVRIITPGTVVETSMLEEGKNNFLSVIFKNENEGGACFCDISTGEIYATSFHDDIDTKIIGELGKYSPREIIGNDNAKKSKIISGFIADNVDCLWSENSYEIISQPELDNIIVEQFGEENKQNTYCAKYLVGNMINYIKTTQKVNLSHINALNVYSGAQYMDIDLATRRNLELTETMRTKEKKGSLLNVLDKTSTSMGGRLLRKWIEQPLINPVHINKRLNGVSELKNNDILRSELLEMLKGLHDLERLAGKIVYKTVNARDLQSLSTTLMKIPAIKELLKDVKTSYLKEILSELDDVFAVHSLVSKGIIENPPFSVREGEIIAGHYNTEVDRLRSIIKDAKGYIAQIEAKERENTGIKTLKIKYNKVFGYYIEITNSNLGNLPEYYIRKQTLSNCERYITEELKEFENTVINASGKITALEYELFTEIVDEVSKHIKAVQQTALAVARLDGVLSFAEAAVQNNYTLPIVDFGTTIDIKNGRHPVVEDMLLYNSFVPNDTYLNNENNRISIITGPNMAGKSTYMRQTALIVLMAQVGSFVPASSATIGVCDKIFTRIGASDDLASGQSTFMVEMMEVANILKNATEKSLAIYDEVGRGTSTFDGLSIAQAVLEYSASKKSLGCKVLFATHYHELTELEGRVGGVVNYSVSVKKQGDTITFLRKIERGRADDSYGIEVAKLAGVPNEVITRAKTILKDIESGEGNLKLPKKIGIKQKEENNQITLGGAMEEILTKKINKVKLDELTPREALDFLYELKDSIVKVT